MTNAPVVFLPGMESVVFDSSITMNLDARLLRAARPLGFPAYTPTGDVSPVRLPGGAT